MPHGVLQAPLHLRQAATSHCRLPPHRPTLQGITDERQLWHAGATVNWRGTRVLLPQRKPKAD